MWPPCWAGTRSCHQWGTARTWAALSRSSSPLLVADPTGRKARSWLYFNSSEQSLYPKACWELLPGSSWVAKTCSSPSLQLQAWATCLELSGCCLFFPMDPPWLWGLAEGFGLQRALDLSDMGLTHKHLWEETHLCNSQLLWILVPAYRYHLPLCVSNQSRRVRLLWKALPRYLRKESCNPGSENRHFSIPSIKSCVEM